MGLLRGGRREPLSRTFIRQPQPRLPLFLCWPHRRLSKRRLRGSDQTHAQGEDQPQAHVFTEAQPHLGERSGDHDVTNKPVA